METPTNPEKPPRPLSVFLYLFFLVWIVFISFVVQFGAWFLAAFVDQFPAINLPANAIHPLGAPLQALLIGLPLLPLAIWWRETRYRAIFQTWFAAAVYLLLLAPTHILIVPQAQGTLLLQIVLSLVFAGVLVLILRRDNRTLDFSRGGVAIALGAAVILALGWFAWGALGSILDVVLALTAALAFGLVTSLILYLYWQRSLETSSRGVGWDTTLGGFVIAAMLIIMASALGSNGMQALLMVALAGLSWLAMDVSYINRGGAPPKNTLALTLLIGLTAAAPLLFMDPDLATLDSLFEQGEALSWGMRAVGWALLAGLVLGILLFLVRRRLENFRPGALAYGALGAVCLVGGLVYFLVGQPGLYGDQLFIVMKDQADVTSATTIGDYIARRAFVYHTLVDHSNASQADLRSTLAQFNIKAKPYYLVNGIQVDADWLFQFLFSMRGDVDRVLPAPVLRPLPQNQLPGHGTASKPASPQWNLTLIGADRVWKELGVTGKGILVGQSDSGVEGTHPELSETYRGRDGQNDFNWLDPWNHTASPTDIQGHGTHTLGSIVGKSVGVAPDANWIACVNLARNLANPGLYLDCMQFMLAPFPQNGDALRDGDPARGAQVLNNSWGCPDREGCDANAFLPGVRALRDAGVFVVASAGNEGPRCSTVSDPPALYDDAFSVGAIDRRSRLAEFSSRGPVLADGSGRVKPDIAAPGVRVLSAFPGDSYEVLDGTSMAGPHIVGVVALMWSANPKLIGDIDHTEQILRETAQRGNVSSERIVCGDPNAVPNDFEGFGIVDAYAAVKRALAFNP